MRAHLFAASIFAGLATLPASAQAAGHIYLLKGGFGGVFSAGMNELAEKLTQHGYTATVHSYDAYGELANQAARAEENGQGPIIIIGHSFGANDAILMADRMAAAGARVALVVTFGPTENLIAPSNVAQVINFYLGGTVVRRGPGFSGTISNVNLDRAPGINHFNIDEDNGLHADVIAAIAQTQMAAGREQAGNDALGDKPPPQRSGQASSYRQPRRDRQTANW